jgi:hypothetical protein
MSNEIRTTGPSLEVGRVSLREAVGRPSFKDLIAAGDNWQDSMDHAIKQVIFKCGVPSSSLFDTNTPEGRLMKQSIMNDLVTHYGYLSPLEITFAFDLALTERLSGLPKDWKGMYGSVLSFSFFTPVLNAYGKLRRKEVAEKEAAERRLLEERPLTPTERFERWRRAYFDDIYPLFEQRKRGESLRVHLPEVGWRAIHSLVMHMGLIEMTPERIAKVKAIAYNEIKDEALKEAADESSDIYKVYLKHYQLSLAKTVRLRVSIELWIDSLIFNSEGEDHNGMNSQIEKL